MDIKQTFQTLPNWADVPVAELQGLLDAAQAKRFEPGTALTKQYHPATNFYFMYSGDLKYYIQLDKSGEQLSVGQSNHQWTAVGWSAFREPHRYSITIQSMQPCHALSWESEELKVILEQYPKLGYHFLSLALHTSVDILAQSRNLLASATKRFVPPWHLSHTRERHELNLDVPVVKPWLQRSAFFEGFDEDALHFLAGTAKFIEYQNGEIITPAKTPDNGNDGLYMLVNGTVALYYSPQEESLEPVDSKAVFVRNLDIPGQIVSWSSVLAPQNCGSVAVVSQDALLCFISSEDLNARIQQDAEFGLTLAQRLLFLVGNQLRSTRAQLINQQFKDENFSVLSLLEQNAPQLSVFSQLHKVPQLLTSRLTQGEAFRYLEMVKNGENKMEKNLAGICLDLLEETHREWNFYKGLLHVYESVVNAPRDLNPAEVRGICDTEIANAVKQVRHVIQGTEYLPDEPGNIFILNHLVNHPYNALPNHFELAMDTHFVSAMVLQPKYGDGGVRVVRKPRNEEFGHQDYYNRLGYIYVATKESEQSGEVKPRGGHQLEAFVSAARDALAARTNLVICPEGTSLWSEESPGPFKPGAFYLAGSLQPEPLIVPIAVANFDKRLHHTTLAVVIKPPFRISNYVDVKNRDSLAEFLLDYRKTYRGYVQEAQRLADNADNISASLDSGTATASVDIVLKNS